MDEERCLRTDVSQQSSKNANAKKNRKNVVALKIMDSK
jgi:hypothetical protein